MLGLAIRCGRYLLRFPLWPDESFLAAGLIDGTWGGMLGNLDYHQVAPLFFLWAELIATASFGFNEYALRLFPFLCGIGSLFLFLHLARRLLRGAPLLLAVAIFAVSYYPVRHGAEVKPYSTDLAVSLGLLVLAVEWLRDPARSRRLWHLAAAAVIAVGLSFPAVFVAGGISLGLLATVWRVRSRPVVLAYLGFNLVLALAFGALYRISTGPQLKTEDWLSSPASGSDSFIHSYQEGAWAKAFPPLQDFGKLAGWLVEAHTGPSFAYPNGGSHGGSTATFVLFVVGAFFFFRQGRRDVLGIFLAPFALAFTAAAMHRYPYGAHVRFNLYLAPAICILAGTGAARLLGFLRPPKIRSGIFTAVIAALALAGAGMLAIDLGHPYKNEEDLRSREFARRFWSSQSRNDEVACVWTDLGQEFFPRLFEWGHSARYLCHQRMFSPLHRAGRHEPDWGAVSSSHPLRCVVFSIPESLFPFAQRDEGLWRKWFSEMESQYDLEGREVYTLNDGIEGQHETYEVYRFVPKHD